MMMMMMVATAVVDDAAAENTAAAATDCVPFRDRHRCCFQVLQDDFALFQAAARSKGKTGR